MSLYRLKSFIMVVTIICRDRDSKSAYMHSCYHGLYIEREESIALAYHPCASRCEHV